MGRLARHPLRVEHAMDTAKRFVKTETGHGYALDVHLLRYTYDADNEPVRAEHFTNGSWVVHGPLDEVVPAVSIDYSIVSMLADTPDLAAQVGPAVVEALLLMRLPKADHLRSA